MILKPKNPQEIEDALRDLRADTLELEPDIDAVIGVLDSWSSAMMKEGTASLPGVSFLSAWLRRINLERVLREEFGLDDYATSYMLGDDSILRVPVGLVGHWPAGNIPLQSLLSASCALIGGNQAVIRIPSGQEDDTGHLLDLLERIDTSAVVTSRIRGLAFGRDETDLHDAMARGVDGAMIWGGEEAVTAVRGLPFPHWARLSVFGPRMSIAMMDNKTLQDDDSVRFWARRLARDVWQFEQKACSSPQCLFVEKATDDQLAMLMDLLATEFETLEKRSPLAAPDPSAAIAVAYARADWMISEPSNSAKFPLQPTWTVLTGKRDTIPVATQNRVLTVLSTGSLEAVIGQLDGAVQTLGTTVRDPGREKSLAAQAARHGVDRIVPCGQMNLFGSPWDGQHLVAPFTRLVRFRPARTVELRSTSQKNEAAQ